MKLKTVSILFISLVILMPFLAFADIAPQEAWTLNLGGNRAEIAYDMAETSDGGYVVVGQTRSMSSSEDMYVIKLTPSGEVEWEKHFGGTKKDAAKSVQQTADGGYIVGGWTSSFNVGVKDFYIIKLDSSGELEWEQTFGGSQTDECEAIIQTRDGGYLAAGQSWMNIQEGNAWLIKLDASGNKVWDKMIGGGLEDGAYDVRQTTDRGFIVAGYTRSATDGTFNMYIVRTDSDGNIVWKSDFGGSDDDKAYSIEQHRDGYIAAGYSSSNGEYSDIYLVRMDLDGNRVWEKFYGSDTTDEEGYSIMKTTDGGYVVAGKTNQFTYGAYDMYLLKLDREGNEQWSQVFGGENDDYGYKALQNSRGGYVITGQTKSIGTGGDVYIIGTEIHSSSSAPQGREDIPDYGSPGIGVISSLLLLMGAAFAMRRRL